MISKEIKQTVLIAWPLFAGLAMIMLGNGLQGTLLGLRASFEGFPVFVTGIVMSLYYGGFLIGCMFTPKMITSVGHIRVFAALASLASTTILLHGVFVDPWLWGFIRIFSGISFAGLFIVAESWLNSIATNKLRAQIFGIYLLVINGSLFGGQFMINLAPLSEIGLFVLISILVSLSMLPLTLANKPSPGYEEPEALPLRKLLKTSKLSLATVFTSGFCSGSMLGIGAVYATEIGKSNAWAASFLATYILGSAILPLIIGSLSDRMDRRKVIIIVALLSSLVTGAFYFDTFVFVLIFIFGGLNTSLYSVGLAYMNDSIKPEQSLSASTSLILISGIGAMLGPLICGGLINAIGTSVFFIVFAGITMALFVFGLYRAWVGDSIDVEEQGEFINMPSRSSHGVMHITEDD